MRTFGSCRFGVPSLQPANAPYVSPTEFELLSYIGPQCSSILRSEYSRASSSLSPFPNSNRLSAIPTTSVSRALNRDYGQLLPTIAVWANVTWITPLRCFWPLNGWWCQLLGTFSRGPRPFFRMIVKVGSPTAALPASFSCPPCVSYLWISVAAATRNPPLCRKLENSNNGGRRSRPPGHCPTSSILGLVPL